MSCIICEKIAEKKALIIYEDNDLVAVLPSKPAIPGHVKIFPKKHVTKLDELSGSEVEELFFFSNVVSSSVFEAVQAHGTNIILNESENHLTIDVIPRKEGDGLDFMWKPKQLDPAEMESIYNKIQDASFGVGQSDKKREEPIVINTSVPNRLEPESKSEPKQGLGEKAEKEDKEEKVNYLIRQLERIP